MAIQWQQSLQGKHVLQCSGVISSASASQMTSALAFPFDAVDASLLEADLSAVEYFDSCGFGFLLQLRESARQAGCDVALTHCSPLALKQLKKMRFDKIFLIS